MHVNRLHSIEASPTPVQTRTPGQASVTGTKSSEPVVEGPLAKQSGSQVAALQGLLHGIPETRDEVVARAREKVANGDYLTRPSAEATAEVFLRSV